jgi:hypothetical protein
MKLQNVNKVILLLYISVLTTTLVYSKLAHKELLENSLQGKWQYFSVDKGGKSVATFTEADTMVIAMLNKSLSDSFCNHTQKSKIALNKINLSFAYKIPTIKKDAFGLAELIPVPFDSSSFGVALKFRYSNKSISSTLQTRIFNLHKFENDTLVIREGALYFRYIRKN